MLDHGEDDGSLVVALLVLSERWGHPRVTQIPTPNAATIKKSLFPHRDIFYIARV